MCQDKLTNEQISSFIQCIKVLGDIGDDGTYGLLKEVLGLKVDEGIKSEAEEALDKIKSRIL